MTPAGTSNELDVQNGWEENTHTFKGTVLVHFCFGVSFFTLFGSFFCLFLVGSLLLLLFFYFDVMMTESLY